MCNGELGRDGLHPRRAPQPGRGRAGDLGGDPGRPSADGRLLESSTLTTSKGAELSRAVVKSVTATFTPEGIEFAVLYSHEGEPPTPGSKTRTSKAARMARMGLETALKGLDDDLIWTGFATDTRTSRDTIMVDRKPRKEKAA
jgi:hypothetical protein